VRREAGLLMSRRLGRPESLLADCRINRSAERRLLGVSALRGVVGDLNLAEMRRNGHENFSDETGDLEIPGIVTICPSV